MRVRRLGVGFGGLLVVAMVASMAHAQAPAATATGGAAPPAGTSAPAGTAAPADNATDTPKAPASPATGYGYGDAKPARSSAPHAHVAHRAGAPVATLPGFEMLADGGSRLFVQVSKNIDISELKGTATPKARKGKKAAPAQPHPTITYVLKGAQVIRRNNQNALETVHFNTPVMRARLVPAGRDVRFIVDLRADTTPAWKLVPAKEGAAILQIDFPKGDFLPAGASAAPAPAPAETDQGAAQPDDAN